MIHATTTYSYMRDTNIYVDGDDVNMNVPIFDFTPTTNVCF